MNRFDELGAFEVRLARAHIKVLKQVIDDDVKGKDRERGNVLLTALTKARRDYEDRAELEMV